MWRNNILLLIILFCINFNTFAGEVVPLKLSFPLPNSKSVDTINKAEYSSFVVLVYNNNVCTQIEQTCVDKPIVINSKVNNQLTISVFPYPSLSKVNGLYGSFTKIVTLNDKEIKIPLKIIDSVKVDIKLEQSNEGKLPGRKIHIRNYKMKGISESQLRSLGVITNKDGIATFYGYADDEYYLNTVIKLPSTFFNIKSPLFKVPKEITSYSYNWSIKKYSTIGITFYERSPDSGLLNKIKEMTSCQISTINGKGSWFTVKNGMVLMCPDDPFFSGVKKLKIDLPYDLIQRGYQIISGEIIDLSKQKDGYDVILTRKEIKKAGVVSFEINSKSTVNNFIAFCAKNNDKSNYRKFLVTDKNNCRYSLDAGEYKALVYAEGYKIIDNVSFSIKENKETAVNLEFIKSPEVNIAVETDSNNPIYASLYYLKIPFDYSKHIDRNFEIPSKGKSFSVNCDTNWTPVFMIFQEGKAISSFKLPKDIQKNKIITVSLLDGIKVKGKFPSEMVKSKEIFNTKALLSFIDINKKLYMGFAKIEKNGEWKTSVLPGKYLLCMQYSSDKVLIAKKEFIVPVDDKNSELIEYDKNIKGEYIIISSKNLYDYLSGNVTYPR